MGLSGDNAHRLTAQAHMQRGGGPHKLTTRWARTDAPTSPRMAPTSRDGRTTPAPGRPTPARAGHMKRVAACRILAATGKQRHQSPLGPSMSAAPAARPSPALVCSHDGHQPGALGDPKGRLQLGLRGGVGHIRRPGVHPEGPPVPTTTIAKPPRSSGGSLPSNTGPGHCGGMGTADGGARLSALPAPTRTLQSGVSERLGRPKAVGAQIDSMGRFILRSRPALHCRAQGGRLGCRGAPQLPLPGDKVGRPRRSEAKSARRSAKRHHSAWRHAASGNARRHGPHNAAIQIDPHLELLRLSDTHGGQRGPGRSRRTPPPPPLREQPRESHRRPDGVARPTQEIPRAQHNPRACLVAPLTVCEAPKILERVTA